MKCYCAICTRAVSLSGTNHCGGGKDWVCKHPMMLKTLQGALASNSQLEGPCALLSNPGRSQSNRKVTRYEKPGHKVQTDHVHCEEAPHEGTRNLSLMK